MRDEETIQNEAAYWQLVESIKASYPYGQYVGIAGGKVVADAADFDELHEKLRAAGKNPYKSLIVQAGHKYPKYATIFFNG